MAKFGDNTVTEVSRRDVFSSENDCATAWMVPPDRDASDRLIRALAGPVQQPTDSSDHPAESADAKLTSLVDDVFCVRKPPAARTDPLKSNRTDTGPKVPSIANVASDGMTSPALH